MTDLIPETCTFYVKEPVQVVEKCGGVDADAQDNQLNPTSSPGDPDKSSVVQVIRIKLQFANAEHDIKMLFMMKQKLGREIWRISQVSLL